MSLRDHNSRGKRSTNGPRAEPVARLERETFLTSRLVDFCARKELIGRTGHEPADWPLVLLKELADNGLDAAEDARTPPEISVKVDGQGVTVTDNGPGVPPEAVKGVVDFGVRASSKEAYVSPTRGQQGNALQTVVAMPFVLDGDQGRTTITARGLRHEITLRVDRIRQEPVLDHRPEAAALVKPGTTLTVHWPASASQIMEEAGERFLQIAHDYTVLNPHLTLTVDWYGKRTRTEASDPGWTKWRPSDPTCPHCYTPERFERLVCACLAADADRGRGRTLREFVSTFRGATGSANQKKILEEIGLSRAALAALRNGDGLDHGRARKLLDAMRRRARPLKPAALGVTGRDHLTKRFEDLGCEMETFKYKKVVGVTDGLPWLIETAFAWRPGKGRRLITGVNWSPGIVNPFRQLGRYGQSLDSILERQRAGRNEPVVLALHLACPRVDYTDLGKSAVVIGGDEAD
jgi:DNA topoisomerase VI subunit B